MVLFASLLIGTIIKTLGEQIGLQFLSQRNANQHRNQNAHQQGLQLSGPHDHAAHRRSRRADLWH